MSIYYGKEESLKNSNQNKNKNVAGPSKRIFSPNFILKEIIYMLSFSGTNQYHFDFSGIKKYIFPTEYTFLYVCITVFFSLAKILTEKFQISSNMPLYVLWLHPDAHTQTQSRNSFQVFLLVIKATSESTLQV